jgi:zinc transport system ATP-binding protein
MQGPAIEFDRVSLRLGNTAILNDVSFRVASGSLHCIVGANGGGKTSLVRALLGQMPHTGRIGIEWRDGRVIGYVPQGLDFDRSLPVTVLDFMALASQRRPAFLGIKRANRALIESTLGALGMSHRLRAPFGSLSGGERQRVLLAQALIPAPALLVLDEPMTGLDLGGKDLFEQAIRRFVSDGGTALWINHDIVQVHALADALTYIDHTVLLDGPPRDVLRSGAAAALFPTLQLPTTSTVSA